ncbi:hypothetical protein [Micromonospora sp. L32]|uniref:hypothetical protein n=1 Tax=Micromonospora sp. L32 TaxID=3452214 RepID=UPI003F8C5C79
MRTRHLAAALLLVAALAGCSSDKDPGPAAAPAASPTSASPSPTVDDRAGCRAAATAGNAFDFDPASNRAAGQLAAAASVPGIANAGQDLIAAADKVAADPGPDANLDLRGAQLAVAEACAAEFGDGPW